MPMSHSDPWKHDCRPLSAGRCHGTPGAAPGSGRDSCGNRRPHSATALARRGRRNVWVSRRLRLSRRTLTRWRGRHRQSRASSPGADPARNLLRFGGTPCWRCSTAKGTHIGLAHAACRVPRHAALRTGRTAGRLPPPLSPSVERLTWHGAGCVWATDHVVPPNPIDGVDHAALAVRDLASGAQLAWQPVSDQTTAPTVAVLKSLIDQHGPPLVLKSDNGSAFKSEEFGKLLAGHEIVWLPSPAYMPWYNGSCEAGNGSMRTRTNHFARRARGWTRQSLESARRQANELTRPQGHLGPTPSELWDDHRPISPEQRSQFRAAIATSPRRDHRRTTRSFDPQNKNHQRQVHRQAVRQALLELGLLTITRRSIPLPLKRKKRAKIS